MNEDTVYLTVSQVNDYIKTVIDNDKVLSSVNIRGEISNFTNHRTGHLYFSLKDDNSLIRAVMFKSSADILKFQPENGMKITARGRISVFPRDGQYQFYAYSMEPDGIGSLYLAYEQLKKKLEAEGLFKDEHKKPIPKIPRRIGVITSPTGAAVRDIINVLGRRFPFAQVYIFPAQVQGDSAPGQLIEALNYFNDTRSVDVIIIGRGGGSIEDLWAFNNEELARTIYACSIPVISAVGHQIDFTICDFVADIRAPTPSAAAELAVPETTELQHKFDNIISRMKILIENDLSAKHRRINDLSASRVLSRPMDMIEDKRMRLFSDVSLLESRIRTILALKKNEYMKYSAKIEATDPMAVLERGYSVAYSSSGTIIKSIDDVSPDDEITVRMGDGSILSRVVSTSNNKPKG